MTPPLQVPIPLLALAAVVVLACGSTHIRSSTASPMPQSPVADLTPGTSPTPVPAATAESEDGVFRTVHLQPDGRGDLPIVLQDRTGLVVGIEAHPAGVAPFEDGVTNPGGQPNTLTYVWTGGACDTLTSITFERFGAGFRITQTTKTIGDACILIGYSRGIDIHVTEPVDADSVQVGNG